MELYYFAFSCFLHLCVGICASQGMDVLIIHFHCSSNFLFYVGLLGGYSSPKFNIPLLLKRKKSIEKTIITKTVKQTMDKNTVKKKQLETLRM